MDRCCGLQKKLLGREKGPESINLVVTLNVKEIAVCFLCLVLYVSALLALNCNGEKHCNMYIQKGSSLPLPEVTKHVKLCQNNGEKFSTITTIRETVEKLHVKKCFKLATTQSTSITTNCHLHHEKYEPKLN